MLGLLLKITGRIMPWRGEDRALGFLLMHGKGRELYMLQRGKHLAAELKVPIPQSQQCLPSPGLAT